MTARTPCWSLVAATQGGDMQSFGTLYQRHAPTVRRFLLSRTADHDLADDLTSETFLRALRGIHSVRDRGREVRAWLVTIARNAMLDRQRSMARRREISVADIDPESRSQPSPELHVEARLLREELLRCLAQLGTEQGRCLVSRIIEDRSVEATAAAMGRTPGAVRALQYRACRRLRELLESRDIRPNHSKLEPFRYTGHARHTERIRALNGIHAQARLD